VKPAVFIKLIFSLLWIIPVTNKNAFISR